MAANSDFQYTSVAFSNDCALVLTVESYNFVNMPRNGNRTKTKIPTDLVKVGKVSF